MKQEEKNIKKAVALHFDENVDNAPRVVASGKGDMAGRILELARANNVPVHKDPTLVNMLSYVDVGSEIPPELYGIVAEVLVFVYSLDKNAKKA
ncbi:flagellar biosynthesis protein FlhB [Desulfocucumis palustris]|uniref:Flagellar biosynthesis protein FlhB n=1 Tax=Desulfocucumis palustris TaxID=1898651 RepID=A0A2L2XDQ4_9FIRM|nr:EscU/YscU/HrcU family type III secretion system export apparatus switch protein [Desulfocucumis palustris]GBF32356.1 flagellar biosynthesis protein FlhB [Desulfocucumis palustris]